MGYVRKWQSIRSNWDVHWNRNIFIKGEVDENQNFSTKFPEKPEMMEIFWLDGWLGKPLKNTAGPLETCVYRNFGDFFTKCGRRKMMNKSENCQNSDLGPTLRQVYDHFFWSRFFLISPAVFFKPFSFHLNNQNFFNQSGFFGILVEKIPILVDPPP